MQLNVPLDDELHRRARIAAATAGITLKELVARGIALACDEIEDEPRDKPKRPKR